jgi:hypothetical protein
MNVVAVGPFEEAGIATSHPSTIPLDGSRAGGQVQGVTSCPDDPPEVTNYAAIRFGW